MGYAQKLRDGSFSELFVNIIRSDQFRRWHEGNHVSQLCVIGGPGSGKSSFVRAVLDHLNDWHLGEHVALVSIHMKDQVICEDHAFYTAFLISLYQQLFEDISAKKNSMLSIKSDDEATLPADQVASLRDAIYIRLHELKAVILIFDDIHLCHPLVADRIEEELSNLQAIGVRIMTTSRMLLPVQLNDHRASRSLLYHLNLRIPDADMSKFVKWDLEREHGDLGLNSAIVKPITSHLGRSLLWRPEIMIAFVEGVVAKADGNIAIVKLYLDATLDATTALEVANILSEDSIIEVLGATYDDILDRVTSPVALDRDLVISGLLCALRTGGRTSFHDIKNWTLEARLLSDYHSSSAFTLDRLLRAANGLLIIDETTKHSLRLFHDTLAPYIMRREDEGLFWTNSQMKFGRLIRSVTTDDEFQPLDNNHISRSNTS